MTALRAIVLSAAHASDIEDAARTALPYECCGVLVGRSTGVDGIVTDVVRLRNSDTRPGRFSIPDMELRRAQQAAQKLEGEIVAVFHSHAGPAVPSHPDRAAIAYSAHPWVIVGFDERDAFELAAFLAPTAGPLPLRIEPGSNCG